jgi:hypothetical protein
VRVATRGLGVTAQDAAQMATVEWTLRHNAAVNYGWRTSSSHMLQPLGHMHDAAHWDYS